MSAASVRRSPLALVVLAQLAEKPMHSYALWQLMRQRQKDQIVNIASRNSLYQVMERLVRDGLAEVDSAERPDGRPERTVYRITDAGRSTAEAWVEELLGEPRSEYPSFPVALSLAMLVSPDVALAALTRRRIAVARQRDEARASLAAAEAMTLPPLFVLDDDYRATLLDAELNWLDAQTAELAAGTLTWSPEYMAEIAARFAE